MNEHPLALALGRAAAGEFPPIDGRVEVVPPDAAGHHAVVEFTGHAYVLTDRPPTDPVFAGLDGFGSVTQPEVLTALARGGVVESLDAVLVRRGDPTADALPKTDAHDDHPRVVRSRLHRDDVAVYGDDRGLVTVGRGLVGRTELSIELVDARGGRGVGRALIRAGLATVAADEWVWAQVSPGNAASLRAFLACGFTPIGAEVLFEPAD